MSKINKLLLLLLILYYTYLPPQLLVGKLFAAAKGDQWTSKLPASMGISLTQGDHWEGTCGGKATHVGEKLVNLANIYI